MVLAELPLDLIQEIDKNCESHTDRNQIFIEALRGYFDRNRREEKI